jgi:hypothetical protein
LKNNKEKISQSKHQSFHRGNHETHQTKLFEKLHVIWKRLAVQAIYEYGPCSSFTNLQKSWTYDAFVWYFHMILSSNTFVWHFRLTLSSDTFVWYLAVSSEMWPRLWWSKWWSCPERPEKIKNYILFIYYIVHLIINQFYYNSLGHQLRA